MKVREIGILAFTLGMLACINTSASAAPAVLAPIGVSLGLPGFGDIALDESQSKLFVSSGVSGNSVAVANTVVIGAVTATVNNLPGATGMVLSADSSRLYVALASGDAIAVLDTSNNTEITRYPTGAQTCPSDLARTGDLVWFSYGCAGALTGKIGLLDPAKPAATAVTPDVQGAVKFARPPLLASNGATTGPLIAAQPATSLSNLVVFTPPTTGATTLTPGPAGEVAGSGLTDLTITPDGKTLITAAGSRDRAQAFSTTDLSGQGAYSARPRPDAVTLNPAGTYLAVGALTADSNDVQVYQPGTSTPVTTHTLGPGDTVAPRGLAFARTLDTLFVITLHDGQPRPSLVTITAAATL